MKVAMPADQVYLALQRIRSLTGERGRVVVRMGDEALAGFEAAMQADGFSLWPNDEGLPPSFMGMPILPADNPRGIWMAWEPEGES